MKADLFALAAVALWASLATLATSLSEIPPFFMTGVALIVGSLISLPLTGFRLSGWRVPARTLAVGVYGLFGYHLMLFIALKTAPAVEANLVNYLWPLLIVVLTPLFRRHLRLTGRHVLAAVAGFAGAGLAILSGGSSGNFSVAPGFFFALVAAFIWASYSHLTTIVKNFPTSAIGLFALVSGIAALTVHFLIEEAVSPSVPQWLMLVVLGLGPLGGAFYFWDAALKIGDPRRIGLLAFITPLASTTLLLVVSGRSLSWQLAVATLIIVGAAWLGSRSGKLAEV